MGISAELLEYRLPLTTQTLQSKGNGTLSYESDSWKPGPSSDHPLMINLRNGILKHRLQSAAHFDVVINVKQTFRVQEVDLTRSTRLNVVFGNWGHEESSVCRPVFRKLSRRKVPGPTKRVEVYDQDTGCFIALNKFLNKAFPCFPDEVGITQMRTWWTANGKAVNWTRLPTELKEQVIQYCIHQPPGDGDHRQRLSRWNDRARPRHARREFGIYEIVDKLTDWAALLGVSHQVRAITLRLCFYGSSDFANGFSVLASSCHSLDSMLKRLGRYFQMTDTNSLPIDYTSYALADCYKQYPRIFPQLGQYATFRHGIGRVQLEMDFIAYMHFFRVNIGSFRLHLRPGSISYEIFEQLPHLSHIAILLPRKPNQGWVNDPHQPGPRLFYHNYPCPRTLHRIIYERIAELLTLYINVEVTGFVDLDEETRYNALRKATMQERKWSIADYEQLYAECGGGIELNELVQPGNWLEEEGEQERQMGTTKPSTSAHEAVEDFFPPKCRCEEKCLLIFNEQEKRKRYYMGPVKSCDPMLEDS